MDNIYENLKLLCAQREIPVSKVETDLGYTEGTLSNWKKERRWMTQISEVSRYLGVSIDQLFYSEENKSLEPDVEWFVKHLISSELTPKELKVIVDIADVLRRNR